MAANETDRAEKTHLNLLSDRQGFQGVFASVCSLFALPVARYIHQTKACLWQHAKHRILRSDKSMQRIRLWGRLIFSSSRILIVAWH